MLSPKKVKYRKQMKNVRHLRGHENRGVDLEFGDYGLRAMESGWVTNRQIEASRVALSRHIKRGGKIWVRIFPDKPVTQKPLETRQGSGKGSPEKWVAEVRAGRIMYELTGVDAKTAKDALLRAGAKLCVRSEIITRRETLL